jgi:tyrosine-specific transport protein
LLGAVIGAGILGIPYVVAKAGLIPGLANIIMIALALLALNLMVGEVVLRTKGDHQLTGYARIHVGKTAGALMALSMVIGVFGALLAYFLGMGEALSSLIGGSQWLWITVTFVVMGFLLAQRLELIERSERYLTALKIIAILIIGAVAFFSTKFSTDNFSAPSSWTLPFGVVLFSLLGTAVIPEMREELKGQYRKLKPALIWASAIAIVVYILFAVSVVGVTGVATTEISTVALGSVLGSAAVALLNIFAVLAMASAFLALGEALKKAFIEDYGWDPRVAWATTMIVPLALLLLGARSFINIIGITGAVAGGIDGIIIVMMYRNAMKNSQRKPEYVLNMPSSIQIAVLLLFVFALFWAVAQMF